MVHFEGTEHETRRCPRRHLLDSPELVELFTLRRRHGDRLGDFEVGDRLTTAALEGLDAIDAGAAWRAEDMARGKKVTP